MTRKSHDSNHPSRGSAKDSETFMKTMVEKTQASLLSRRQAAVPRGPFNIAPLFADRAAGCHLWDMEGKRYIDFCSGIGVLNVGHNHPKVVAAIQEQVGKLIHSCWHVVMYEPYLALAERLNALVPILGPNKTVFFNSGAEAGENAVKIARVATGRSAVLTFERAFHGRTLLGMTMTGKVRPYTAGFGPFAPEIYRLPWEPFFSLTEASDSAVEAECRQALEDLFTYHVEPENIACVLMEPVLGEGGFLPARRAAIRLLRDVCRQHGILFVSDEVQSGFARSGELFASQRYDLEPDMVLMAKSLAGGLPLSGVTGSAAIMDAPEVGGLGGTFGGNPLACAAGLAVLDVIEEEGLSARAMVIGEQVMACLSDLESRHDWLTRSRGLGAMCGIEVVDPATGHPDKARAVRWVAAARERGLLLMTASGYVLRTLMPLIIGDDDLVEALQILRASALAVENGKQ